MQVSKMPKIKQFKRIFLSHLPLGAGGRKMRLFETKKETDNRIVNCLSLKGGKMKKVLYLCGTIVV